jgi:hypothetical protein
LRPIRGRLCGMFKIGLGSTVKDKLTQFTGIVTWRCEYMNRCIRYGVQPVKLTKDGKPREPESFDESQLVVLKKVDATKDATDRTGGPQPAPTRAPDPR